MNVEIQRRWNYVYSQYEDKELGWHQDKAVSSLKLLRKAKISKDDLIVDIGSGTSVFRGDFHDAGYRRIIAVDISETALRKSSERLVAEERKYVTFVDDDICNSTKLNDIRNASVWHDRAELHFLTTSAHMHAYVMTLNSMALNSVLKQGEFVIFGVMSLDGPNKCSGLDIVNYDAGKLAKFLGKNYQLLESFTYKHYAASGKEMPLLCFVQGN